MDMHLAGKVAVVTGASKGIGLATTRVLLGEGARVVAGARTATGELSRLAGDDALRSVGVDLSTPDGPAQLVEVAIEAFGRLDILVNNVGAVTPRTGGFLSVTDDDWASALNLNLLAAVRTTRAALPHLLDAGSAAIVSIASVNATLPDPLVIDYSAAKSALLNFSKSLSKEVGRRGVRVNTISPGPVSTGLWLGTDGVAVAIAKHHGGEPDAVARAAAADSVTSRFTRPEEVADLVLYLASDRAENVTGADFVIDGGLITTL
jgi:NAD(P)-dependent dehydrogenase (short-subunit alcohol dehydrogenase family)